MKPSYTLEQNEKIDKDVCNVCNQLFNIARENNQKINTIAYDPGDDEIGTMFKMWWGETVRGVKINGGSFRSSLFMNSIDKNDCNVLIVHEKLLNVEPSIKLIPADHLDLSNFDIKYIKHVIIVRDDVRISNNITSFATSCAVDDWVENRKTQYTSIKEIIAQQTK